MKTKKILGIDIGGSGIKGAIVDTKQGVLLTDRHRIETPEKSTPEKVAEVIGKIVNHFDWNGPVGVGFPGVIQHGIARTAANVDDEWLNAPINKIISKKINLPVHTVNDADAAGLAEMKFGAGKNHRGVILLVTVGTGIGTVILNSGKLVPNMELGHIILNGQDAEQYASDAARKKFDLSWEEWAKRFNEYLKYIEVLLWPDLIILGGGVSKKMNKFEEFLTTRAKVVPAEFLNEAGIVGAALAVKEEIKAQQKEEDKANKR